MPRRGAFLFSCALHVAVVALFFVHLPFLERPIPEETPIVVDLVNIAPETRATQKTETPPVPEKPKEVAQNEPTPPPPQPEPKPEPPKPQPPPPTPTPPAPPPPPPPPPPEPKPPEPKPPEPKPEPPKPPAPRPEVKPQPPKQKEEDADFDALLKNLAKRPLTDTTPEKAAKPAPAPQRTASSQPIAPLGAQLSTSEIDLVRQQIERCWNVPAGARDAENLAPEFRIQMNPDGSVRDAQLLNTDRISDPFFQAAADSAKRAILNSNCHGPLKFPPDKFDQWQSFTITFDPKDIT